MQLLEVSICRPTLFQPTWLMNIWMHANLTIIIIIIIISITIIYSSIHYFIFLLDVISKTAIISLESTLVITLHQRDAMVFSLNCSITTSNFILVSCKVSRNITQQCFLSADLATLNCHQAHWKWWMFLEICGAFKHARYGRIWLHNFEALSKITVFATQEGQTAGQTSITDHTNLWQSPMIHHWKTDPIVFRVCCYWFCCHSFSFNFYLRLQDSHNVAIYFSHPVYG